MMAMGSLSRLQNFKPLSAFLVLFNSDIQTQKSGGNRPIVWDIGNVPHNGPVGAPALYW